MFVCLFIHLFPSKIGVVEERSGVPALHQERGAPRRGQGRDLRGRAGEGSAHRGRGRRAVDPHAPGAGLGVQGERQLAGRVLGGSVRVLHEEA